MRAVSFTEEISRSAQGNCPLQCGQRDLEPFCKKFERQGKSPCTVAYFDDERARIAFSAAVDRCIDIDERGQHPEQEVWLKCRVALRTRHSVQGLALSPGRALDPNAPASSLRLPAFQTRSDSSHSASAAAVPMRPFENRCNLRPLEPLGDAPLAGAPQLARTASHCRPGLPAHRSELELLIRQKVQSSRRCALSFRCRVNLTCRRGRPTESAASGAVGAKPGIFEVTARHKSLNVTEKCPATPVSLLQFLCPKLNAPLSCSI
jgi:hypothetical protein